MGISFTRHLFEYEAIKSLHEEKHYPIQPMCEFLHVSRSAYYKWLKHPVSPRAYLNTELSQEIRKIYDEHPDMGYRRLDDEISTRYHHKFNDKRILRICRALGIQSTIKHWANSITRRDKRPYHTAKNELNRDFHADKPNEKWLTDVSEFKYDIGVEVHKVYLSAILDLYDRRIVSFVISDRNDNPLVMNTFDQAIALEPHAHPLMHSDRGFQYTSQQFCVRLKNTGMKQSMSRVAHCIDNGPMEGFWGMMKREKYYGHKFTGRESLIQMISAYIDYYNNGRLQRNLSVMTPMAYHQHYLEVA
ncbi:hypothetical protein IGI37_000577 [Enterococcus sp. AZ194]|uniref:IS3 family transposase n=1 Tax=Enterococcus sp. AZ194 TaxID=2774629 RepID=UPI003F282A52